MRRKFNSESVTAGALVLLTVLGLVCRFIGLNWDSGYHQHPDERFLTAMAVELKWPHSVPQFFNSGISPLNPFNHGTDFYVYGQFPLVLVKAVATLSGHDNYDDLVLVGRVLSALFDALSVLLVFCIGRRLGHGYRAGLLAAALMAWMPLHIQQAHFFVVDTFAVTFLLLAFWSCQRAFKEESIHNKRLLLAGAAWGVAVACKFSSVFFALPFLVFLLPLWRGHKWGMWRPVCIVLFSASAVFRLLHPIAFTGEGGFWTLGGLLDIRLNPQFWGAMAKQAAITSGKIDVPFNLQWYGRTPLLWPLWNLGGWGVGWPLLLVGLCGCGCAVLSLLKKRTFPVTVTAATLWLVFSLLFYGLQFSKFTRYFLPATPFLALLAAWVLLEWRAKYNKAKLVITTLGALTVAETALWGAALTSLYTREHTRVAATKWMLAHIPPGTAIAKETAWDDVLPLVSPEDYDIHDLQIFETDTPEKRSHLLKTLDSCRYIVLSSPRAWKTIPRLPGRFPITTRYYTALLDGQLGFTLVKQWNSSPQVFGLQSDDGDYEEALSVNDHPRVMIFEKAAAYTHGSGARLLGP